MDTAVDLLELVARAQRGDEASISALIVASAGRLRSVARSIVRDPDLADEATQRALIGIWQHLPSLRDPAAFESWSYRLVANACNAELRGIRGRHQPIDDVEVRPSLAEDLAGPLETLAERDQLERAFARLPVAQRSVVALHHQHDLVLEDVAAVLGIPVGTAWSRLHRAMDGLRAALAADARPTVAMTGTAAALPWVPARKARPWVPSRVRPAPAVEGGRLIVVAQDGSGDTDSISAAVSIAEDGDLVLFRPGIYRESVVVDRDIAIVGDGDQEAIVLDFRGSMPQTRLIGDPAYPSYCGEAFFGFLLSGTNASIVNLTIRGPRDGVAIVVRGGAPSITHVTGALDGIWQGRGWLRHFLFVSGGAGGRIADCSSTGHVHIEDGSSPTVEWNDFGAALVVSSPNSRPLIRHNSIVVKTRSRFALGIHCLAAPLVEHNEISWPDGAAIAFYASAGGIVRDNVIRDSRTGISIFEGGDPTIVRNDVQARTAGIFIAHSRPVVTGNILGASGGSGIVVAQGAAPALERNTSPWQMNPSVRATGRVA